MLAHPGVHAGNAAIEGIDYRGWFLGHFVPPPDLRSTATVELKWVTYEAGETRSSWAVNRAATTVSVLVQGHFRMRFREGDVVLQQPGDYVLWLPGVPHSWTADAPSIVLAIRFPSLPNDSENLPENLPDNLPDNLPENFTAPSVGEPPQS